MRTVELDLAVGGEHQHAVVSQVAQQVVQQRERALIRPVEVVEEYEEPACRGERLQETRDVVE
jgi:hypothetical protein